MYCIMSLMWVNCEYYAHECACVSRQDIHPEMRAYIFGHQIVVDVQGKSELGVRLYSRSLNQSQAVWMTLPSS